MLAGVATYKARGDIWIVSYHRCVTHRRRIETAGDETADNEGMHILFPFLQYALPARLADGKLGGGQAEALIGGDMASHPPIVRPLSPLHGPTPLVQVPVNGHALSVQPAQAFNCCSHSS